MNESIFEDTFFGNGSIAGTPADEDVEELIDIPEADDESSSEGDTPSGNILELLSRMRGLMPNSDGDEDMDDNDMDSDDYHNKAVDRARRGRNREATDICMEGLKKFPLNVDLLADTIKYSSERLSVSCPINDRQAGTALRSEFRKPSVTLNTFLPKLTRQSNSP